MTLLEMLAVLAILASMAAVTIGVIPSVSQASRLQAAKLELRGTLERARALATRGGGAVLVFEEQDTVVQHDQTPAVRLDLPEPWGAAAFDVATGEPIASLRFDGRGRSIDTRIELTLQGMDEPAAVFTALGLSGQLLDEGPAR